MTEAVRGPGWTLPTGIVLASMAEAVASTALGLARADIVGDLHATPDEFAWLDIAYGAAKLMGFALSPWLIARAAPRVVMTAAVLAMGIACALSAAVTEIVPLVLLRAVQGLTGAVLLVAGQAILFWAYAPKRQPLVQAIYALGAVVAPATLAPAIEGCLADARSWAWIFFGVLPLAFAAAALVQMDDRAPPSPAMHRPPDWPTFALLGAVLLAATYGLSQGSRWDWFEAARIRWWTLAFGVGLLLFILRQRAILPRGPFDLTVFRSADFAFAMAVSFVAGAALFGSGYLIPAFATALLGFTPTDAGLVLLPSGVLLAGALLLTASLVQARGVPPIATVPLGILTIMAAMWMLSSANRDSGFGELLPGILLRGLGLGFLFLSITLIAFTRLPPAALPSGIALFNIGRQIGGLTGVAGLQTLIEHHMVSNKAVLGATLTHASSAGAERVATLAAFLSARGIDAEASRTAAEAMLGRAVTAEASAIAFNTAFAVVALSFLAAAPVLVTIRVVLNIVSRDGTQGPNLVG